MVAIDPIVRGPLIPRRRMLVIGVGNLDRGDDAVGIMVSRRLRDVAPEWMSVCESGGDMADLIERWRGHQCVIVMDAMRSGAEPGTVQWFDASREDLPADCFASASTHALGLAPALAMARILGGLPPEIRVVGIEGARFGAGEGLSEMVNKTIEPVAQAVLARANPEVESYA